ncbi:Uncharacterised protein [BD1-7 clade bacterium]|uniref:Uncharacterized protein n=1 Tax=BD1-7 clade bacterium TaxID=2029982 RepID=A0A5S9QVH2_9GAMM|nr:Uncharacterised protein [BD1-7 clade bacterium]CAA0122909.1 Uncharacterised protein [BD1-7 clade bacterium]
MPKRMKRKPGNQQGRNAAHIPGSQQAGQDAIWEGIRTLKTFTRAELTLWLSKHKLRNINDTTVKGYIRRLNLGGYLTTETTSPSNGNCKHLRYTLIKNTGTEAPRLTQKGTPSKKGKCRENMWRTMKVISEFDYRELALASSNEQTTVSDANAKAYIKYLHKAGYLHRTKSGTTRGDSRKRSLARYRLLPSKNTGPQSPQIQSTTQVYDPNLQQVIWSPTPQHTQQEELCDA